MSRFANQSIVITGAAEGIGFEIAHRLATEGASVLLNDLREDAAEAAAERIRMEGGICVAMAGDASDVDLVRGLVDRAVTEFGRLDACCANAGMTAYGDFFSYEPERLETLLNLNLRGTFFLVQAAAKRMREQGGGGRVLMTASVCGRQAVKYLGAYGMTKAAIEMLARNLVLELSPHGISINCIAPGPIVTPRNLEDDPDYETNWAGAVPMGRAGSVADCAEAALFLLAPNSGWITGQNLVVDGGWTCTSPTPSIDFVEPESPA